MDDLLLTRVQANHPSVLVGAFAGTNHGTSVGTLGKSYGGHNENKSLGADIGRISFGDEHPFSFGALDDCLFGHFGR